MIDKFELFGVLLRMLVALGVMVVLVFWVYPHLGYGTSMGVV